MRTLNISGETEQMLERRAQNTLELLPPGIRTSTLLCIYRVQVCQASRAKCVCSINVAWCSGAYVRPPA